MRNNDEEWVQIQILIPPLPPWVKYGPRELLRNTPVSFGIWLAESLGASESFPQTLHAYANNCN
jgi:hypothetical protein